MTTQLTYFLFFLVIASTTTYSYSSTKWRKLNDGNFTIIDKYIPYGQGKIRNFNASSNNLKFSMEENVKNISNQASISVYAYLPPFPFDGSKIPKCRFQNIPIRLWIYPRSPSTHKLNQMPEEIVIQSITFEFSQQNIVFYLQGSTYTLDLNANAIKPLINGAGWTIIMFAVNIMAQFIISGFSLAQGMFLYRFLTLSNTMSAYEFLIIMRNHKLEHIEQLQAQILLYIICLGPLSLLFAFVFRTSISWKKLLVALALSAYSTLIAFGYIAQIFVLIEIYLQQAIITSKYLSKQYPGYFLHTIVNPDYYEILLIAATMISIIKLLFIGGMQIIFQSPFDYRYFYLCLILLLLILNESCLMKNPSTMMKLRARLRRIKNYQRVNEEIQQQQ